MWNIKQPISKGRSKVKTAKRKPSVLKLRKKLDKVFSMYIRQRDKGVCFTCGVKKHWKEMQAGHYISRSATALRFDERNVNCQCMPCNVWKHGAMDVYALKLQALHGDTILHELQLHKHKIKRFTVQEIKELISKYESLLAVS